MQTPLRCRICLSGALIRKTRLLQDVLFWKPHQDAYVSVLAGSFDEPTGLQGQSHIFVGDKGDYYSIEDGLPQFEKSTPPIKLADG
ncbi:hypothetical protein RFM98_02200 [Mesorhizobium sp. VK9D]|uniref:GFA family protein n=1 Tax=Mesorhizobium australafricanum TaxID=3072311 RepID=UPI002A244342|nr:hypothetical protein [Mesorhizobium sp. VK9D]MDX8451561.1 hypothetical protein [Mesorhizobium sp. VK9D]